MDVIEDVGKKCWVNFKWRVGVRSVQNGGIKCTLAYPSPSWLGHAIPLLYFFISVLLPQLGQESASRHPRRVAAWARMHTVQN